MKKLVILLIGLLSLVGCKTKYVSVPEYHTEYVYRTDSFTQKDSIYMHDSVWVEKSGDTITTYKTRYVYKDRWRDVIKIDSFIKTDSVRVPYPVEKELTKWQQLKMDAGLVAMVVCGIALILVVVWLIMKFTKR